jgi:hypothetical protein
MSPPQAHGGAVLATLADNIVRKQLPRIIADAEALLAVAAWRDLPAGLRIIDIVGRRLCGFCVGSGHRFAQAHGCREGVAAVAVATEEALRHSIKLWADDLSAALGEAALIIEYVAAHEAAHAIVANIDADLQPGQADILRKMAATGTATVKKSAEQTVRDHPPSWAAAVAILSRRCSQYRPRARHRWPEVLRSDLEAVGIDAQAVAEAVGDVGDEQPLRALLAAGGNIVCRVAAACSSDADRVAILEGRCSPAAEMSLVAASGMGKGRVWNHGGV